MSEKASENGADEKDKVDGTGWRDRLTERGEDAVSRLAHELVDNPIVRNAVSGVMGAGEKVSQAQEAAMGALRLPSTADVEQLARRIRSLSERLERVEDSVDRVEEKLGMLGIRHLEDRLQRLESRLRGLSERPALDSEVTSSSAPT